MQKRTVRMTPAANYDSGEGIATYGERSVARYDGIDVARPFVDAARQGLSMIEALVAKPHGDRQRSRTVVTKDYDMRVGIEFRVGARGDFAHGHEQGIGQAGGLKFPRLADVEQDWGIGTRGA